jgi:hypothetical protein
MVLWIGNAGAQARVRTPAIVVIDENIKARSKVRLVENQQPLETF